MTPTITLIQGKCRRCKRAGLVVENNNLCITCAGKLAIKRIKKERK